MKNVLERFDKIIAKMDAVNRSISQNGSAESTGFGPRFRKMFHQTGKRVHSIGIYDYHTKRFVLFEMINMVGNKSMPVELEQMERMLDNAA